MLNANLPVEWQMSPRFDGLSDTAWRVFTHALMWSMAQQTDGAIPMRYVRSLHPDGDKPDAYQELVRAGVWKMTKTGVQMQGWAKQLRQSSAETIEHNREKARIRMRNKRENEKKAMAGKSTRSDVSEPQDGSHASNVPRDVRPNVSRDVDVGEVLGTSEGPEQASTGATKSAWDDVEVRKPGAA